MVQREEREYQGRHNDQPEPVRALLRARSLRGDANMDTYKAELTRVRSELNPRLVAQLVALLGYDSRNGIEARMILEDLYTKTWLVDEDPPIMQSEETLREALTVLVDALGSARDRNALEHTLMLFLQVAGVGELEVDIPSVGVRVALRYENGAQSYGSGSVPGAETRPSTYRWEEEIDVVAAACQEWCRQQLRTRPPRSRPQR
jgi:hypothetical protein